MRQPPQRTYRIAAVEEASATARLLRLDGSVEAQPGQFAMVWLPGVGEKPFSLAGADPIELVVEPVGPFSQALCALGVGEPLTLRVPLGRGFTLQATATPERPLLLVGGGCGAAPLRFAAIAAAAHTVLGAATTTRLILPDAWPGPVETTTDDGSRGFRGTAVDRMRQLLPGRFSAVLACGPERMIVAAVAAAEEAAVPVEASLERYMKCGVGLCGHCAVDPTGFLVCSEGPVAPGHVCRCLGELGSYHRDATGRRVPL